MSGWNFPPLDEHFDYADAMRALASEDIQPVHDQHVVSKVGVEGVRLTSGSWAGLAVGPLRQGAATRARPSGPQSLRQGRRLFSTPLVPPEKMWHEVETRLDAAIKAAEADMLHQNKAQIKAVKDGIALHLVRTPYFRRVHERALLSRCKMSVQRCSRTSSPCYPRSFGGAMA
jgi:hypothetical protein